MDLAVLGAAAAEYCLNRLWLRDAASGWVRTFLVCYANDIFAGAFMLAWLNLLLGLGRLGRLRRVGPAALFLLGCGLVWEVAAPVWKPEAVFDLWDLAAYQVGGLAYLGLERLRGHICP